MSAKAASLLGRLWRDYVSRYTLDLTALVPALALVALTGVSYALILKFATDNIEAGDLNAIALVPVAVITATLIRAGAIWAQAVLSQGLALKVLRDLQAAMFTRLMGADFARFAQEDGGKLVSRFTNDVTIVGEGLV
ncbi:MAG: ABC transporter transmembrane domain-containing protein, partial [Hyphomonadaceae bacterium]